MNKAKRTPVSTSTRNYCWFNMAYIYLSLSIYLSIDLSIYLSLSLPLILMVKSQPSFISDSNGKIPDHFPMSQTSPKPAGTTVFTACGGFFKDLVSSTAWVTASICMCPYMLYIVIIRTSIRISIRKCICKCKWHVYASVHVYVYASVYAKRCVYIHTHTCTYIYMHIHTITYIYIQSHTYTYIFVHLPLHCITLHYITLH